MIAKRIQALVERTEALDPDPGWFGPVPEDTIEQVEHALGVRLSPTFREFVARVGGGGPLAISGIHPDDPMGAHGTGMPSLYDDTDAYREYGPDGVRDEPFPRRLLVVLRDGDDHYTFCLDHSGAIAEKGEAPVIVYDTTDGSVEPYASDFAAFYERLLRQQFDRGGGSD